ncbi:hypothetical protein L2U69_03315 [Zavarzinia compransoris]|uniref:ImuA family protein n=1 Tax=Zavarzinia marina TaxID=2911065 RepID=UPI001F2C3929|nr:hypothetical protein [Zavarzinia marina]MCF4164671.1 hypothetical protein [Zavarzinia marina]
MTLQTLLRRRIARIERGDDIRSSCRAPDDAAFGLPALDGVLGGGLAAGALHEFAGAAGAGIGLGLAAGRSGALLWIAAGDVFRRGGWPYGPGLAGLGLDVGRLLLVVARDAVESLWAAEEAMRCKAVAATIIELAGDGRTADLTATRRLSLAAREGGGLGFLMRERPFLGTSAAVTRWTVAPVPGPADGWGGLGDPAFDMRLTRNRRGPAGRWTILWRCDERRFALAAPSLDLAAPPAERPHPPAAALGWRRAG